MAVALAMQSMACAGALQSQSPLGALNSPSPSLWARVNIARIEPQSKRIRIVARSAGGRGARGSRGAGSRGRSNWSQDRRGSGTVSKDYGSRDDYGSKDYGSRDDYGSRESQGSYRGNGRGSGRGGSSYRGAGRGSYRGAGRGSYGGAGRGYRGGGNGSSTRGGRGGRYDELRRLAEKRMHDGAFEILDEESGEKVIVWGVEDADSWPKPSAEDLKWKPSTMAVAGDISEEGWYKAMEASMDGPSGAFSVKGVRQGGVYDDEEDEDEDDYEDDDYSDDEEDDEFDDELDAAAEMPEEPPRVAKTVRPARLKVFGRDFKQKEMPKSEPSLAPKSQPSLAPKSEPSLAPKSEPSSAPKSEPSSAPKSEPSLAPKSSLDADSITVGDDVEQAWPPVGHVLSSSSVDEAPVSNTETEQSSDQNLPIEEEELDQQWPPAKAKFSSGDSSEESVPAKRESTAWKNVERVVRVEDWKQGEMNPGIIDLDEDDEDEYERIRMADRKSREKSAPARPSLLDDLRLQTHKKLGSKPVEEDVEKPVATGRAGSAEKDSSNVTVVKPRGFRDLKARTNYDPSIAAEFFSTKSFKDVGASEEVIAALTTLQLRKPSAIQAMAFKPILEGQSCIVADQTGSGKTLAYLAPLVQMLRAEEEMSQTKQSKKPPRVLVLVPTSELAVQVLNVCRAFARGGAPFRSIVLTGGFKWKTQVESLAQGPDVVVATPGRFLQHLEKGSLKLDNLKTVVLDEVDILYDDEEFTQILDTLDQAASRRVQYVHVTATLPVDIHDSLLTRYPDAIPLMGPTLHRTAVGLQEVLVDCSGAEGEEKTPEKAFLSKKAVLLQLVDQRPVSKTIIFCNKIETCRDVENALYRHDRSGNKLTVLPYHAALSQEARLESMQQFLESSPSKNLFLVCTDRASRGLDSFDVEHVVLFDFPRDPSEYVRRVGRTARGAGGTGKVFVFALGKQVAMARRIMDRNEKGRPIHDIPGTDYET